MARDGSSLPYWIYFNQNKLIISPPKGIDESLAYDVNFQLTDSLGASSFYKLSLQVLFNSNIELKQISNVSLVNPQNYTIRYYDILNSELYYNLNSSISLVNVESSQIPSWIIENITFYQLVITSKLKYDSEVSFKFKFKIIDLCGDPHYTNIFTVTLIPNSPPTIVNKIDNGFFYEGMLIGKIPVASELFADPGDSLSFFTTR